MRMFAKLWNSFWMIYTIITCVNPLFLGQVNLTPGKVISYLVSPGNITEFTVRNLTWSTTYLTFQVHTQYYNVTVSSTANFSKNDAISGSHVGMVTLLKAGDTRVSWFVTYSGNQTIKTVVVASVYGQFDPVPGGCNQVYTLAQDPNLHQSFSKYWTDIDFALAGDGAQRGLEPKDCDSTYLNYELYVTFIKKNDLGEEEFLSSMQTMMTAGGIVRNGIKVHSFNSKDHKKPYFSIGSVVGQGAIYAILVRNGRMSSYVSIATYACDLQKGGCQQKFAVFDGIIAVLCGIAGLLLCFVGHRYFKTELFILGFVAFFIIFYLIITKFSDLTDTAILGICVIFGIVGGLLYFLLWFFVGFPLISVLFGSLVAGYIFSSLLFFTPFGNLKYWQNHFNYGITFTCGILILPAGLVCFSKTLNILTCTFVGSYGVIVFIDYFLRSSLKYIILNSVRHSTVTGYLAVIVSFPFQMNDIILSCVWVILFVVGSVFQFQQSKGKAPFPPCPYKKLFKQPRQACIINPQQSTSQEGSHFEDEERRPLLGNQSIRNPNDYQSACSSEVNRPA